MPMSTLSIDPNESIYLDMYRWGLKQIPIEDIERECSRVGKEIRKKDYQNYYNGFNKSRMSSDPKSVLKIIQETKGVLDKPLYDFKVNKFEQPRARWVPCNEHGKPLIKWTQQELYQPEDVIYYPDSFYYAENLKHCHVIVLDIDADHGNQVDEDTLRFFNRYMNKTHCLYKESYDGVPKSYHLTFYTDRIIPTVHCSWAHVDILGNEGNQLRYRKNKARNGLEPMYLTPELWDEIRTYLKGRKVVKR